MKKLLTIYLGALVFLFGIYNGVIFSQSNSKSEQIEQLLPYWQMGQSHLRVQLGISKEDFTAFKRFYKATFDLDHSSYNTLVIQGKLDVAGANTYIANLEKKYISLYSQFETVKKNYPATVAEYNTPENEKKPMVTCNPGCTNIGFENGTLSSWNVYYGVNNSTSSSGSGGTFNITGITGGPAGSVTKAANDPNTSTYQVAIMSGGHDALVPSIPRVPPTGGNFSVRLGDTTNPGQGVAIINQTFSVTAANAGFQYQYALLLEDPAGHTYYQQPFFKVTFFDQLGDTIKCNTQLLTGSNAASEGLKAVYYAANGDSVYYKNWTTVLAPLSNYIGQCVTVEFKAADCALGGHFGYAYVQPSCNSNYITSSSPSICSNPFSLTGPGGAASYKWTGPCIVGSATGQTINVNCAGKYQVVMTRLFGTCTDTIDTVIVSSPGNAPVPLFKADTVCAGNATMFTNLTAGTGITYKWNFGDANSGTNDTTSVANPTHTYPVAGKYTATLTALNGTCGHDTTETIVINSTPTITITSSPKNDTVCTGGIITLTANGATSYTWSGGISNGVAFSPSSSGKYVVIGSVVGCSAKDSVNIVTSNKALPTITVTSSPTNDSVCIGSPVTLTASGGKTYSWSGGITNAVAFTPAASGQYIVTGTDANGCSNRDTVKINVDKPKITVTSSPSNDTVCKGASVTLTASGAVSYVWSGGTAVTNGTPFVPTASGQYIVTGTDARSCKNKDTVNLTVNPTPTLTITSSPKNDTVCTGGSITLSGNGALSYLWSGGITNAVAFSPSTSGKYVVTGTGADGCMSKDSVNVVASTKALPTITVTSSPANDTICQGSSITLSGNGGVSYSWSGGITNAKAFVPTTSGQYIVTGTASSGCSNRDTVKVTIDKPIITIASLPANATVCKGSNVTLSGVGGVSYVWSNGITNGTPFTPTASATYVVTGTDKYTCKGIDSMHVVVNKLPTITITSSPKNDTVCPGSSITLSGNGAVSYLWSGGITNAVAFSPSVSGKYVVTGNDANGCSNKDSVNVIAGTGVLPTITATSTPSSDTICKGSSITLSGNGGAYYNWSGGVSNGVAFSPTTSGKYIVTGTNNTGCSNTDTVHVVVNSGPAITITGQTPIISGTADTLTASGGVSYIWTTGGTHDSIIVAPTTKTTYTVTATGANGCSDTASFTVTIKTVTAINTVKTINGVSVYPNPANELLNITFSTNAKAMAVVIRISDITGKQITELQRNIGGTTTFPINISDLAAGMYFVSIETSTSTQVIKFIKK